MKMKNGLLWEDIKSNGGIKRSFSSRFSIQIVSIIIISHKGLRITESKSRYSYIPAHYYSRSSQSLSHSSFLAKKWIGDRLLIHSNVQSSNIYMRVYKEKIRGRTEMRTSLSTGWWCNFLLNGNETTAPLVSWCNYSNYEANCKLQLPQTRICSKPSWLVFQPYPAFSNCLPLLPLQLLFLI